VSPFSALSTACSLSISVFVFVVVSAGSVPTLRVAETENWRACMVRSVLEDVVARLRNIVRR
jgi:hypothetical protein